MISLCVTEETAAPEIIGMMELIESGGFKITGPIKNTNLLQRSVI